VDKLQEAYYGTKLYGGKTIINVLNQTCSIEGKVVPVLN
jgi:hypothetical protein